MEEEEKGSFGSQFVTTTVGHLALRTQMNTAVPHMLSSLNVQTPRTQAMKSPGPKDTSQGIPRPQGQSHGIPRPQGHKPGNPQAPRTQARESPDPKDTSHAQGHSQES